MQNIAFASRSPRDGSGRKNRRPSHGAIIEPKLIHMTLDSERPHSSEVVKRLDLAQDMKAVRRPLILEQEHAIFKGYHAARAALGTLGEELAGCPDAAHREAIERDMAFNRTIIKHAESKILAAYAGFIYMIANQIHSRFSVKHLTVEELVQEGRLGAIENAMPKFDHTKGYYFSTYGAWWIRQAMHRLRQNREKTIRVPVYQQEDSAKVTRFRRQHLTRTGGEPTEAEILEATGVDVKRLRKYAIMVSIDKVCNGEDNDGNPSDFYRILADEGAENPCDAAMRNEDKETVAGLFKFLEARERAILRMRFGIDSGNGHTLEEVGREFSLTRERIRQIEAKALGKLREKAGRQTGCCRPRDGNGQSEPLNATINK